MDVIKLDKEKFRLVTPRSSGLVILGFMEEVREDKIGQVCPGSGWSQRKGFSYAVQEASGSEALPLLLPENHP